MDNFFLFLWVKVLKASIIIKVITLKGENMRRRIVALLSIIIVLSICIGIFLVSQTNIPDADGQTQLKHADLVIGDNIIVHGSRKEGYTFDEGYGTIFVQSPDSFAGKYKIYENIHWAICFSGVLTGGGPEYIVYAWND